MTLEEAKTLINDNLYFGTMMVKLDRADGMVSGAIHTSSDLLRPALKIVTAPGVDLLSSFSL